MKTTLEDQAIYNYLKQLIVSIRHGKTGIPVKNAQKWADTESSNLQIFVKLVIAALEERGVYGNLFRKIKLMGLIDELLFHTENYLAIQTRSRRQKLAPSFEKIITQLLELNQSIMSTIEAVNDYSN